MDILNINVQDKLSIIKRKYVHLSFSVLIFSVIVLLDFINDQSIISAIFSVAGFTYGPLLGLYFFGLFTSYKVHDKFVPYVAIIAPILSYFIQKNFSIGFEILLINGLIVCLGLLLIKKDNVSLTK